MPRRGFSFVELMFAVVVLGIGFIMIAGVFPVGLQQVKTSLDETAAAANARGAVATLEQIAQATLQYMNLAAPKDDINSTEIAPITRSLTMNLPAASELTMGRTHTLPARFVRSAIPVCFPIRRRLEMSCFAETKCGVPSPLN